MDTDAGHPTWSTPKQAIEVMIHPPLLRKTLIVTAIIGTLLFAINHLDVVLRGEATALLWGKAALTYLVPFGVSNYGVLIGTREPRST